MNLNNLFDFSNKLLTIDNTFICIYEYDFYICILSINSVNFTYNYYSDEWLYLINYNYPYGGYYQFFVNNYNNIVSNINNFADILYLDKDVISLMTTFSRGAVHGYSGFYYTLITYLNNFENYKDKDIIMYKNSENGMLTIMQHLCNVGVITANIIYLEKDTKYKFKSVTYIPNKFHVFKPELELMVDNFIKTYKIINGITNHYEKICIIKTKKESSSLGIINNETVEKYCNKYNIHRIIPNNEIDKINLIYNCKILILSYGSCFFLNYVYISELCEKIIVVIQGAGQIDDYNHLNSITTSHFQGNIYHKYKNAIIKYVIVNNELDVDPNIY
jgi:hypothetical protein